jgi:hypothetical protein
VLVTIPKNPASTSFPDTNTPELVTLGSLWGAGTGSTTTPNPQYKAPGLDVFTEPTTPEAKQKITIKNYGNAVGETIQTAVRSMGDQNALLMGYVSGVQKKEAVEDLAHKYDALADAVAAAAHPSSFAVAAENLASGYRTVADGLRTVAGKDASHIYEGLIAYNENVETFAAAFVPYATLFGAHGVTFTPDEPGGLFTPAVGSF